MWYHPRVRNRVATPMLVGGSLVVLVAIATCGVAWLLWARADQRGRADDEVAAQETSELLQNSVGRVLTSLRTSAGLVNARGEVDGDSFQAWARAVGSIGATDALALTEVVDAADRVRFEDVKHWRISQLGPRGVFRAAPHRATYVPIVAVWPTPGRRSALLGFDMRSDPVRRAALERARAERRTVFTRVVPFATGGRGLQAFRPVYAPTHVDGPPVGYVTAWFGLRGLTNIFRSLPPDVRVRVGVGGADVYTTADPPATGAERSVELGDTRWVVTARGAKVSHAAPLSVAAGGGALALMLGLFTVARSTSERRLRHAHEGERAARERSEVLERNTSVLQRLAASLSVAALPADVAEAAVPYLFETFGARLVTVGIVHDDEIRTLKVVAGTSPGDWSWRPTTTTASSPTADAVRYGRGIELHGWDRIREEYPGELEQLLSGVQSLHVAPLHGAQGAIGVGLAEERDLTVGETEMLEAIARELSRSLERAVLLESERDARLQAELMERNAERLRTASSPIEIASATVAEIVAFGADVVFVWSYGGGRRLVPLASSDVPKEMADGFAVYPIEDGGGLVADALEERRLLVVESGEVYDQRYPAHAERRRSLGAESLVAMPLLGLRGDLIGAIFASSTRPRWITSGRRPLLLGIGEQTGVALERARLQSEADDVAEANAFLALLGELFERSTTVSGRARLFVRALTEERATFASVHLRDGTDADLHEVARAGSVPEELTDEQGWRARIEHVIATGQPESAERPPPAGASSPTLVVPLRARGRTVGAVTIRPAAGAGRGPSISLPEALELAARAALALDNALQYERERDVSHTLQLGLLGAPLASFEDAVITSAYRPGTAALEVGGDWYDAFPLASGSAALVVGDVVGHGLEAAVAMGQLRGAVSALARSTGPALLLERLDAFVETVPSAATATLAYIELDLGSGAIRYACAGHPPPLIVSPDGSTRFLWGGRSAPLGSLFEERRGQGDARLEEGETLILYTDGLVERRTAGIDVGLERLADAARRLERDAPRLADEICDALLEGPQQDDDVCVLTFFRMPSPSMFSHVFPAAPGELAGLRERLRAWLEQNGVSEDVERGVVLAVSEAAANAVEHGYRCDGTSIVTVTGRLAGSQLELSVHDEGGWRESPGSTDRGRGLGIIRAIVDEMSVGRVAGATVVRMRTATKESTVV